MDLFHFNPQEFFSFLLTAMRISIIVFMLPFFGASNVPNLVKAAACFILSLAVWPQLSFPGTVMPAHPFDLVLMLLGEVILGLVLDIIVRFLFAAVQTGGQLMGFQMGFSMMNVIDPMTGTSEAITAHYLYQVTVLLFLSFNGHLYLLQALAQSFQLVPPGGLFINPILGERLLEFSGLIFVVAVQIAAPVVVATFLVDLALALVARAAPQMNVLFVGFPLKIGVGFLFLTLVFSIMGRYVADYIIDLGPMYHTIFRLSSAP
ncbi:flagellar biosynthetic protein FliR [Desulfovibrio inopinatus]|uniref:flagellar biosynthetic protein FliR n=1 Tax=Desulfovibrio inopinatus TaxID=102109 RepID=UPI0004207DD7|nr:flagellar biosynthetic protein FliR [Desulfovibrio inopinatus]